VYFLTVWMGIAGTALSGLLAAGVVPFFLIYSHRKVIVANSWEVFRDCYLRASLAVAAVSCFAWFVLRPLASSLLTTILLVGVTSALSLLAAAALGAVTKADWASLVWALRGAPKSAPGETGTDGRTGGSVSGE
jgi:fructose-specific phosphotransferase system IIC component